MRGLSIPERCWIDPRVVARRSPIEGLGLFATAQIHAGEVVAVLGGRVVDDAELRRIAKDGGTYNSAAIGENTNLILANDELLARGNHSCDPNLWMRDAFTLEARREIAVDEELTSDYAMVTAVDWEMTCHCGSPLCRHVIRGTDWRTPVLQQRYAGHFSPFLNARIAARGTSSVSDGLQRDQS